MDRQDALWIEARVRESRQTLLNTIQEVMVRVPGQEQAGALLQRLQACVCKAADADALRPLASLYLDINTTKTSAASEDGEDVCDTSGLKTLLVHLRDLIVLLACSLVGGVEDEETLRATLEDVFEAPITGDIWAALMKSFHDVFAGHASKFTSKAKMHGRRRPRRPAAAGADATVEEGGGHSNPWNLVPSDERSEGYRQGFLDAHAALMHQYYWEGYRRGFLDATVSSFRPPPGLFHHRI